MKEIDYNDDYAFLTETEKIMNRGVWKSIIKGIVVTIICFIDTRAIPIIVGYISIHVFYSQYRFEAAQHYVNRLNFNMRKLRERTNKLKYKITNKDYPNYTEEEIEEDFLDIKRKSDYFKNM